MIDSSKLETLKELIESATAALNSANKIAQELTGGKVSKKSAENYTDVAQTLKSEDNIIEGVFDGQNMIGPDKRAYPIPANYASKSKLVAGDVLKLTIKEDGTFLYKQIGPIERKAIIGILTYDDSQYRVIAEGKTYKVLLASVTYFHAEVGDKVTIMTPAKKESEWAAIENLLPKE
ncbi:MAG: 50S ribosomal protein L7/L12 [Candidatus Peregrinibacteria bacterium GW2011_GWA2_38_36]|nr:MAG: 50S ribosomal protein L7/L12 [Candidatus Peregrinibacteria bacterium GW2011_GWA2_38_36]